MILAQPVVYLPPGGFVVSRRMLLAADRQSRHQRRLGAVTELTTAGGLDVGHGHRSTYGPSAGRPSQRPPYGNGADFYAIRTPRPSTADGYTTSGRIARVS
ncbi:MAG: hypothetical protein QOJ80_3884 [Mycobacterium sp.]|nr:hypothetical protein [Mycobacterium sp.]